MQYAQRSINASGQPVADDLPWIAVCFVDPKVLYNKSLLQGLLDKKQEHAEAKPWVEVDVPLSFLDKLERPKHDFSELDSPGGVIAGKLHHYPWQRPVGAMRNAIHVLRFSPCNCPG